MDVVREALAESPADAQMLIEALPFAFLRGPGAEFHTYQEEVQQFARSAIGAGRHCAVDRQETCMEQTKAREAELVSLQEACQSAAAAEEQARNDRDAKASDLNTVQMEIVSIEQEQKRAKKDEEACKKRLQDKNAAKPSTVAIIEGAWRMLMDGGWEDVEVRDASISAVSEHLDGIETAEKALVAAVIGALKKKPVDRCEFDTVTIDFTNKFLTAYIEALDAEIQAVAAGETEAKYLALGAWAMLDCAKEREKLAWDELSKADAMVSQASAFRKAEEAKVSKQQELIAKQVKDQHLAEQKVAFFDRALKALDSLIAEPVVPTSNPLHVATPMVS